ncbi:22617_t:CDS:10 [Entrophospora sp. SA101]|nr:22617_t:CDS:10 [Entrophospora sp. SA101]
MKELYIGNINFRATESQVEHVLNEFSNSRLKSFSLIRDRGFGFALFENDEDADVLLEASENGIECMGRILSISPSRGKRKSVRNVEDGLMSSLEPSFEIESLELGRWGGGRRQKTRNRNKKSKRNTDFTWTFLSAWSYNDQGNDLIRPTLQVSDYKEAFIIKGFRLQGDREYKEKRVKILFRSLTNKSHSIVIEKNNDTSEKVTVYITLNYSPELYRHKFDQEKTDEISWDLSFILSILDSTRDEWSRTTDWTKDVNAFGNYLVYKMVLKTNFQNFQSTFNKLPIPGTKESFLQCNVKSIKIVDDNSYLENHVYNILPFEISYKLECLMSRGILSASEIHEHKFGYKLKETLDQDKFNYVWHALNYMKHSYWNPGYEHYNARPIYEYDNALKNFNGEPLIWHPSNPKITIKTKDRYAWVYHAYITPTKIYFEDPTYEQSNRILRKYEEHYDRFLRVTFVDENEENIYIRDGEVDITKKRILQKLKHGFKVAGRHYQFLAFSSSQLRESSCWYVCNKEICGFTADQIRKEMGDFSLIKSPSLYAARMGQCFTTTISTVTIPSDQIVKIPDLEITINGKKQNFSDGCGKISMDLARKVIKKYMGVRYIKDEVPSVYQIRFGGSKGVVALDNTLEGEQICVRPSQKKFEAPDSLDFEIAKTVRSPLPAYLNRQIILLLSNLGIPNGVFLDLQQEMINNINLVINDREKATDVVRHSSGTKECSHVIKTILSMLDDGVNIEDEPFLKGYLECKRLFALNNLRYRARIFMPNAYLLMGVVDETGILEPNQIYVHTSTIVSQHRTFKGDRNKKVKRERKVWTGPAVITRNPCMHPGDMRIVEAVDVIELEHLKNCVVFSQRGERPLPNCLGGGDLDGDEFFVCFDERLFFPEESMFEPMNYDPPGRKEIEETININHICEFFADFLINNRLGIIGNLHLAFADFIGLESEECLTLADLHSKAVDFNKSGIPVTDKLPELKNYPDFMEKKVKESYQSQGILGLLYRKIQLTKSEDDPLLIYDTVSGLKVNEEYLYEGYMGHLEKALHYRSQYNRSIRSIMDKFGVQTEPEIISSNILQKMNGRKTYDVREKISNEISHIIYEFRMMRIPVTDESKALASAWYYVTYKQNDDEFYDEGRDEREEDLLLLSFPWVVSDLLLKIREENLNINS